MPAWQPRQSTALCAAWSNFAFVLVLFAVIGLANTVVDVAGMTLLQRSAPDEVLGRYKLTGQILLGLIIGICLLIWPEASFPPSVVARTSLPPGTANRSLPQPPGQIVPPMRP